MFLPPMKTASRLRRTLGLTVTDDSVLEMIEKREQAPRLPVMVLLEPEVEGSGGCACVFGPGESEGRAGDGSFAGDAGVAAVCGAVMNAKDFMAENMGMTRAGRCSEFTKAPEQPPMGMVFGGGIGGGGRGAAAGGGEAIAGEALDRAAAAVPAPMLLARRISGRKGNSGKADRRLVDMERDKLGDCGEARRQ